MRTLLRYSVLKCVFASLFSLSSTSVIPGYGDETRHNFYAGSSSHDLSHQRSMRDAQPGMFFVYSRAPEHLIIPARRNGEMERTSFTNSASELMDDDERMELYAKHFSQCSEINDKSTEKEDNDAVAALESEIEKSAFAAGETMRTTKKSIDPNSAIDVLTDAIGIDEPTSKLFAISSPSLLAKTIRRACLKNELRFQCAFGFLNDLEKIREHIDLMKQNDGNFKVMLESECRSMEKQDANDLDKITSVYSCVNQNAPKLLGRCRHSIETYNMTRRQVNENMQSVFFNMLSNVEKRVEKALADRNTEEVQRLLKNGEVLIAKTLSKLSYSEAFKCRHYAFMEGCVLNEVSRECSIHAANSLRDILRVGYLARERGAELHQHFLDSNIREHRACGRFTSSHESHTKNANSREVDDEARDYR